MNYLTERRQKSLENLDAKNFSARNENRFLWDKIISVSLLVLGFSFTLFSTDFLSTELLTSNSKYFLIFSWVFFFTGVFIGFSLLKKESSFQQQEALVQSLYSEDLYKIMDNNLEVKEDKKNDWIALQVLYGKRHNVGSFWTDEAITIFNENKDNLDSWKFIKKPEDFYSFSYKQDIDNSERDLYLSVGFGTLFLMITVITLIF